MVSRWKVGSFGSIPGKHYRPFSSRDGGKSKPAYPNELAKPKVQNNTPEAPSATPHARAPPSGNFCSSCLFSIEPSGDCSNLASLFLASGASVIVSEMLIIFGSSRLQ